MKMFVDADWVVYAAGFAGEKVYYVCPELFGSTEFDSLSAIKEEIAKEEETSDAVIYARTVVDPLNHVLHSAKKMLETAKKRVEEKLGKSVDMELVLDGDGNFRSRIATIRPYKGKRSKRPVLYNEIRQYLMDNYKHVVIHDRESDDYMAVAGATYPYKCVLVGIDKDLLQIPGLHYNPQKGFRKVTPEQGNRFVYRQAITGDSVDNIGGAYKMGKVAAAKFVTDDMTDEVDMWLAVQDAYQDSIMKYGSEHYNGLSVTDAALENMRLVKLGYYGVDSPWMPPS